MIRAHVLVIVTLCLAVVCGCVNGSPSCQAQDGFPLSSGGADSGGAGGGEGGTGSTSASIGGVGAQNGGPTCPPSECSAVAGPVMGKYMCDDDDSKSADRCVGFGVCGGACAHVLVECDSLDSLDIRTSACDDGNPCTVDECQPYNFCKHVALPDDAACNGGGVCVGGDCTE